MVGIYFSPTVGFYAMGGRSSDLPGSDFAHPFAYGWTIKSATYPDNQVSDMACGVLDDSGTRYIYCVGGSAAGQTTSTARVFRYNPITDVIETIDAPWPGNSDGITLPGGFAVQNNKLYILGGFRINKGMTNQIWEFTPTTNVWVLKNAVLPVARGYIPTAATNDGLIYTGGGSDWDGTTLVDTNDSFRYDPVADSISTIPNIPRATGETRAVVFGSEAYIVVMGGGRTPPNPSNEMDAYHQNLWDAANHFITPRRNFATDSNGGGCGGKCFTYMFVAGGYACDGVTPLRSTEFYCYGPAGSPTPGPNGTCIPAPTPTATPCDTGVIQNSGFETGSFPPWVIDGHDNDPVVTTEQAHSGTHAARVGDISGSEPFGDSSFYQQFNVPAGGGTLSFYHWDYTTDTIKFDWQDAYITDNNGTILQTIFHQCENGQTWINHQVDMTPLAGQTVRIKFLVHQDGSVDDTAMYVDDVVLYQPCATPSPTPTTTATFTPTQTPTATFAPTATATPTATVTVSPSPTPTPSETIPPVRTTPIPRGRPTPAPRL
jgi:hypothetical protein